MVGLELLITALLGAACLFFAGFLAEIKFLAVETGGFLPDIEAFPFERAFLQTAGKFYTADCFGVRFEGVTALRLEEANRIESRRAVIGTIQILEFLCKAHQKLRSCTSKQPLAMKKASRGITWRLLHVGKPT